ncbi:hypothetical protein Hte_008341 [Hypoxylon texense]
MDEFAQLSRENFEVFQRYGDAIGPDPRHRAIAVYAAPGAPTTYVEEDLQLEYLPAFFEARPSGGGGGGTAPNVGAGGEGTTQAAASLKLVVLDSRLESWSNSFSSLWTSKDVFLRLVDVMNMNPSALWLLRSEYDGFHHFLSSEKSGSADTYYIGTSNFVLIWTFDRRCGPHPHTPTHTQTQTHTQTHALWILRQQQSINSHAPAAWFLHVLRRHQDHVRSPFLLAYAAALGTCCTFDGEIAYRAHVVRLIERQTGYSTHSSSVGIEERLGVQSLTVSIKEVGQVLNHNANKERHFRLMGNVLDFIAERAVPEGRGDDREVESTKRLLAAVPLLRSRMHASEEYLKYLKERAERLSTVLFALLTHEDSATHAELADASRQIAEAAQRDSSSMKTVAIMTMAFLPATFFAALFSVPSLDWRPDPGQNVVQSNFWIYWAFTLPATALVFGLWLLFDHRAGRSGSHPSAATSGSGGGGGGSGGGRAIEEMEEDEGIRISRDYERPRSAGSRLYRRKSTSY